jgi:nicotinamide riboside kinase
VKKIVCLWGGPGTGKSTTCAAVFAMLKKAGFNAEMNREYVKDWVWEGRKINHGDQVYITAKQAKKEATYVRSGVNFIITDSPLSLASFYGDIYDKYEAQFGACKQIVKQHYQLCLDHGYKIEHFFLVRTKEYKTEGRLQDEATARLYDSQIKNFLDNYPINYNTVVCDEWVDQTIFNFLTMPEKV